MKTHRLRRRELLMKCAALGSLTVAPSLSPVEAIAGWSDPPMARKPTPWNELGPFYKRDAPHNACVRAPGDPGLPVNVSGQVYDIRGNLLPEAKLEIWQTDHLGRYDLDGYRYRATLVADQSGKYLFESVMPGHYPARVCQHIHYLVTAPGHKALTTQLYFATDPVFEGDPDRNYTRDPLIHNRDLVRPVMLTGDPKAVIAQVKFEIVLERS